MTQPGMKKLVSRFGILAVLLGMLFVTPLAAGYDNHKPPRTCLELCYDQYALCLRHAGGFLDKLQCTVLKVVCETECHLF